MFAVTAVTLFFTIATGGSPDATPQETNKDVPSATSTPVSTPAQVNESAVASAHEFKDPHEVLFAGSFEVDVMDIALSPRMIYLAMRLAKAAREDPNTFAEKSFSDSDEPKTWYPECGLTKEEHEEFLQSRPSIYKKATATLTITSKENDVYVLDGGDTLSDLNGIQIDLKNDIVCTPFGIARERSEIHADDDSALGAWNGVQWSMEILGRFSGGTISLSVGRLEADGRAVLYYDARVFCLVARKRIEHILIFDAQPKKQNKPETIPSKATSTATPS